MRGLMIFVSMFSKWLTSLQYLNDINITRGVVGVALTMVNRKLRRFRYGDPKFWCPGAGWPRWLEYLGRQTGLFQ